MSPTPTQTATATSTATASSTPTVTTTPDPSYGCPCSIWNNSALPAIQSQVDTAAVELSTKLQAEVDGQITGVRFYHGPTNPGPHIASLWRYVTPVATETPGPRQLLASVEIADDPAVGWRQATFPTPVDVLADTTYVVSYFAPHGGYSENEGFFAAGVRSGPLRLLADGVDGPNGLFRYGPYEPTRVPTDSYNKSNYWIDVVFTTDRPDRTPPQVVTQAPAVGASGVDPGASLTATFSEPIRAGSFYSLVDPAGAPVAATLRYDSATRTVTVDPDAPLALSQDYTATLSEVADRAGNTLVGDVHWTFKTAAAPSSSGYLELIVPSPVPTPVLSATFNSIGVEVFYTGDDNRTATANLRFKRAADPDIPASWREGLPLWPTTYLGGPGRAFYGSALFLEPGTLYQVRVTLADAADGVAPVVLSGQIATRAEDLAPAGSLAPTRYVRAGGSDAADGLSTATAWATLDKAVRDAPAGAVVQVGPGHYAGPSVGRTTQLTLIAQFPAVDDSANPINAALRSVIESSMLTSPTGSNGPNPGVWQQVSLPGPGLHGAPVGASYVVWKWSNAPGQPGWLGYATAREAATRDDLPQRVASWAPKGSDLTLTLPGGAVVPWPEGWAEKLYTNGTYRYGWLAEPTGPSTANIYARLPGDLNPNNLFMTAGSSTGFQIDGPDVRISGFEIRPASAGVLLTAGASRGVVDHNLIAVGYAGVRFEGDKGVSPHCYGVDHLVEHNLIVDSGLWGLDQTAGRIVPWNFIKGGIENADGTPYSSGRIGENNETTGVFSRGGARRVVVRRNVIDGSFNGLGAYNSDYDRYATQDQDVHDNVIRNVSDDALEPEQVAINWRVWRNRVERASVFLSTGPVAYGPLYLVRNEAWRIGKDGVGRDLAGRPGVGATFFKYSGTSNPQARVYVLHNTLWTDSAVALSGDTQSPAGVDGAAPYAGSGPSTEQLYMRNNIVRATRDAFEPGAWDEDANSFSTTNASRGLSVYGRRWTSGADVVAYRLAHQSQTGQPTGTNVGWNSTTGAGGFVDAATIDTWLTAPAAPAGDLSLPLGSPFVDGGVVVPNVSDHLRVDPNDITGYTGSGPDLGATEHP